MKLFKKIDLYYAGDYVCSTNQSKTCRLARTRYLETLELRAHSLAGVGLVSRRILKNPTYLKARFSK